MSMAPAGEPKAYWKCPEHDLTLAESVSGVWVEQRGFRYLARGWRLDNELIRVVESFLQSGFVCLIRSTHPRPANREKGVAYIGFSNSPDRWWVVALDASSGQNTVRRLTVNSKLRDVLVARSIPFTWESSGGQNIFLACNDLERFLSEVTPTMVDELATAARSRTYKMRGSRIALESEDALQSLCVAHLSERSEQILGAPVRKMHVNPRWASDVNNLDPQTFDIPDIVVECEDCVWILELKLNKINLASIDQAARYARNPACVALASGRDIRAVVIGHRRGESIEGKWSISREQRVETWLYSWTPYSGLMISQE